MAYYGDDIYYDYYGDSQKYQNDEGYTDIDLSSHRHIINGLYYESSSPGSGSSAMTPSVSQSSHGSIESYYTQNLSHGNYVNAYDEQPMDLDRSLDINHYTPGKIRQSGGICEYEPTSSLPRSSELHVSGHGEVAFRNSLSPEDYPESFSPQELSPVSPSSATFPSRSRKSSRASKSDVSYPCLAHYCTSTARFKRVADLQRHYCSVHSDEHYDCPIRKCARKGKNGLGRKDHLRDHLKDVHMQSPEQVKVWMEEVQIITNLRNMKKSMTAAERAEAQEMEKSMPSAKTVLGWD